MNPAQFQPAEEQILLTVADQSKLDLVMELLSHFDLVRAERVRTPSSSEPAEEKLLRALFGDEVRTPSSNEPAPVSDAEIAALSPEQKARLFLKSAGIWEGRDIDAKELRERAWQRDHTRRS